MNAAVCGIEQILGKEEGENQTLKIKNRKCLIHVGLRLQLLYVSNAGLNRIPTGILSLQCDK